MARFSHASGTPTTLDLQLHEMSTEDVVPKTQHRTPMGTLLRYVHGTRYRRASLTLMLRTSTEHDNFLSFYRSVSLLNTRFTFVADLTNYPSDTWSAYFVDDPVFDRVQAGARIVGAVRVTIEDAPANL